MWTLEFLAAFLPPWGSQLSNKANIEEDRAEDSDENKKTHKQNVIAFLRLGLRHA